MFICDSPIDTKSSLQIKAWCQTGNNPLPKPMMIKVSDAMSGLILGLRPPNERRRYFVTTSLIGWAQAGKQHCHVSSQDHNELIH